MKKLRIVLSMGALLISCITPYSPVRADISQEDRETVNLRAEYHGNTAACAEGGAAGGGSVNLPSSIPAVWRNLIMNAAPKHPDADPRLVAAVLWAENRGWPEYRSTGWRVSESSAQGPWQFIPSSWTSMGQDGDGDGVKDPNNPKDAVHAAFVHHNGSAGKPLANEGWNGNAESSFNTVVFERNGNNLLSFGAKYNGSGAPDGVKLKDFPRGQNSDYVRMVYWLIGTNFDKGWHPELDKLVDAKTTKPSGEGGGAGAEADSCTSGGSGNVNTEGYAFPVEPQKKSENGGVSGMSSLPCGGSSCHHDGSPAFDISRKPGGNSGEGAAVYAIHDGKLEWVRIYQGISGCYQLQLHAKDKYYYWYGHIANVAFSQGKEVKAGDKIAEIGRQACTGNPSSPHLHIDRGCVTGSGNNKVYNQGGRVGCRDQDMIPLINGLFEGLED